MSKFDEALQGVMRLTYTRGVYIGQSTNGTPYEFNAVADADIAAAGAAVRAIHKEDEALIGELAGMLTAVWYSLPKSFRDEPKIDALLLKVANRNKPQGEAL